MLERQETETDEVIETAIKAAVTPADAPGALLTGWALVCEWIDPEDGGRWLQVETADGVTNWLARGMLDEGMAMLRRGLEIGAEDDDD